MRVKVLTLISVVMLCALVVAGCKPTGTASVDQNVRMASDIRKAELQRQLDQKWENPDVHYQMGQLYHAEGNYSKADWYYDQAIGSNPAHRDAQAAKVKLQLDRGDKSKSEYLANMYMTQIASSPEQLLALGAAFEKQRLDDYTFKCYNDALKLAPNSPEVNRQLGYYYLRKNKSDLAKEFFIRSFQINPNQPDVANELGKLGVAVRIPQAPSSENLSQPVRPPAQP